MWKCNGQRLSGKCEFKEIQRINSIVKTNTVKCTDTLVGNLSLWSVTPNESSFLSKIGYNEEGMKHKSYNIYSF